MCVIIIKPAGTALPTKRELRLAYQRNHDGCGFASETMGYKSLDFEDFYQHLKVVPQGENCVIHFRWATHGAVTLANCHPFYDRTTHTWFAHNGILPITPYKGKTDSETAFRRYLAPIVRQTGLYSRETASAVADIIGSSRFAFIQDGQLRVFGRYIEHGGCYYSNLHHLPLRFGVAYGS